MVSKGYILINLIMLWFIIFECVIVVVAASVLAVQSSKLKNINSVGRNLFNRYFLLHALLSTEILP